MLAHIPVALPLGSFKCNSHNMKSSGAITTIHQIDSIYQGQLNPSFQKDGFGITLTQDYFMHMGHWKNGKANGLGWVLFPTGNQLFAQFNDNTINGLCVASNPISIQCGVVKDNMFIGMGFQYIKTLSELRLQKLHKGVAIETVKTTKMSWKQEQLSDMLAVDAGLLKHVSHFQKKMIKPHWDLLSMREEEAPDRKCIHHVRENIYFYGRISQAGGYQGLGLLRDDQTCRMIECGWYHHGALDGFGMRYNKDSVDISQFKAGVKEGYSYEKFPIGERLYEYRQGVTVNESKDNAFGAIRKQQRLFNYKHQDFMSKKCSIDFKMMNTLFDSQQVKAWRQQNQSDKAKMLISLKQAKPKPKEIKKEQPKPPTMMLEHMQEKSCVAIMKEKRNRILNLSKRNGQVGSKLERMRKLQQFIEVKEEGTPVKLQQDFQDEVVAEEENPFGKEKREIASRKSVSRMSAYLRASNRDTS